MLSSLINIEQQLKCDICLFVFNQCTAIEECGHRFCLECITEKLRQSSECPVCKVPTQSNDLHRDYLQDNLVDYLDQLKKLSLNHTLTPLELSYQRSEAEEESSLTDLIGKRKKSPDLSPRKRQATDQDIDALLESVVQSSENPVDEHGILVDKGNDAEGQTKNETNISDTQWQCSDCQFDNPIYVQTCGVCRKPKNIPVIQSMRVPSTSNVVDTKDREEQSYMPTVNVDDEPESATMVPAKVQSTESNKRKEVHVMYTGLAPEDEETLNKLVNNKRDTKLKIFVHFKMRDFHDVTHIITSVDNKRLCKRTFKYLQGILEGKWIVTPAWLIDSIRADRWLSEDIYEVKGDHVTGITQAPIKGRERVQQDKEPLFNGMRFYFFGDFTGKHNKNDLLLLCRAGGGKILNRKPNGLGQRVDPDIDPLDRKEPIVIMCTSKKKSTNQWLYESQVRDPSWIIECISKLSIV